MQMFTAEQAGFKVIIEDAANLTESEKVKLQSAVDLWAKVWNTTEFKKFCIGFKWEKKIKVGGLFRKKWVTQSSSGFRMTELSNISVLNKILSGQELDDKNPDQSFELSIKLDRKNVRGVLGYAYYGSIWQYTYANFFHKSSVEELAGHLSHEACHRLGFSHEFKYNSLREFTVPYAVGYFTRDLGRKLLNGI